MRLSCVCLSLAEQCARRWVHLQNELFARAETKNARRLMGQWSTSVVQTCHPIFRPVTSFVDCVWTVWLWCDGRDKVNIELCYIKRHSFETCNICIIFRNMLIFMINILILTIWTQIHFGRRISIEPQWKHLFFVFSYVFGLYCVCCYWSRRSWIMSVDWSRFIWGKIARRGRCCSSRRIFRCIQYRPAYFP